MLFGSKRAYISNRKVFSKLESENKKLSKELLEKEEEEEEEDNSFSSVLEDELEKFHSSDSEEEKSVPRKASDIEPVVPGVAIYSPRKSNEEVQQEQRFLRKRNKSVELANSPACLERSGSEEVRNVRSDLSEDSEPEVNVQPKKGGRKISISGSESEEEKEEVAGEAEEEEAFKGIERMENMSDIVCSSEEEEEEHVNLYRVQQAKLSKAEKRIQEAAKKRGTLVFNKAVKKHKGEESKPKASSGKHYKQEVDTNVLAFDMSVLKDEKDVFTGDPIFCKSCKAVLNNYSQITTLEDKKEQVWICEFCGNSNEIQIEPEDQPKKDEVRYILEPAPNEEEKKEELKVSEERKTIIFCVDISGSMDTAQTIKVGKN